MPLPREHGGDPIAPSFLDNCQDTQFVIDQDVMVCGVTFEDVIQFNFFVHVNQYVAIDGGEQRRASDFPRLKYYVAVRQDYGHAILLHVVNNVERIGEEPVGEGILNQKFRNRQQVGVARILTAIALQGAQIIRIPKLGAQFFKKLPVALLAFMPDFFIEMLFEISGYSIIVEQSIVHVEQENQLETHFYRLVRSNASAITMQHEPAIRARHRAAFARLPSGPTCQAHNWGSRGAAEPARRRAQV